MKLFFASAVVTSLVLSANACFAVCVDFDGNGRCIEVGSGGNVPMPTGIGRVSPTTSGSNDQQTPNRAPAVKAPQVSVPSTASMVRSALIGGIVGGLLEGLFAPPPAPAGPTPAEIEAERQRAELQRIEDERRHQAFLRSKSELAGRLRGPGTTYVEDRNVVTTGGLALKSLPTAPPAATAASAGDAHSAFFGQSGAANPSVALLHEPQVGAGEGLLSKDAYLKAISKSGLTQEERERLFIRTQVAPGPQNDHPMIDSRAFIEKERYSDLYLDLATAGAKAGATTLSIALVEEKGKGYLKAQNVIHGYDELLSASKTAADYPQTTAGKVVALGDFALTKAPGWTTVVDAGVNAGGAVVRQGFVRYWAAKASSGSEYVPNPRELSMQKWNGWYADQGEWTKAALDRVGAGEFK